MAEQRGGGPRRGPGGPGGQGRGPGGQGGRGAGGSGRTSGGRPGSGRGDDGERRGSSGRSSSGERGRGPSGSTPRTPGSGARRQGGDDRFDKLGQRRGDWKPRERRTDEERTADQQRYDGPEIPEHITGKELDRSLASQLRSLPDKLAVRVARHLVAAQELIGTDPKTAYKHTLAARARAGRLAMVREAVGEAAYAAGEYAEAATELRSAKRMNGAHDYVAIIADCDRALGKPDKALTTIRNAPREKLAPALLAELTIVEAGARRDRKELDAALRTLENAPLMSKSREPWVARLRYAYADALVAAGRPQDAIMWFHRTEAVDPESFTDAAERAAQLEREAR